jgi:hypothetical protein
VDVISVYYSIDLASVSGVTDWAGTEGIVIVYLMLEESNKSV